MWTAIWLSAAIGLFFGALVALFGQDVLRILASTSVESELLPIVPWIAALIPMALLNGVFVGALEGRQRFVPVNVGQVLTTVLMQLFPTVSAYLIGPELKSIVPAAVIARLLSTILMFGVAVSAAVPARPRLVNSAVTRLLLSQGGWFSLASILGSLLATVDKFVIGGLIGPSAVAHYSVPESVVRRTSLVPLSMVRSLFPRLTSLEGEASRRLAERGSELVILIMTPIAVVAILGVRAFLTIWVGEEFSVVSAPIGALIAFGLWFNSVAFVPEIYLQARGKASISVFCSAIELLPHLLLLYVGLTKFGLLGGAIALLLITIFDMILLVQFAGLGIWRRGVFWSGCGFVCFAYIWSITAAYSKLGLVVSFIVIAAATSWSCLLSEDLRSIVRSMFRRAGTVVGRNAI
jgi:O-antigen/teichoic acid export membrane protein